MWVVGLHPHLRLVALLCSRSGYYHTDKRDRLQTGWQENPRQFVLPRWGGGGVGGVDGCGRGESKLHAAKRVLKVITTTKKRFCSLHPRKATTERQWHFFLLYDSVSFHFTSEFLRLVALFFSPLNLNMLQCFVFFVCFHVQGFFFFRRFILQRLQCTLEQRSLELHKTWEPVRTFFFPDWNNLPPKKPLFDPKFKFRFIYVEHLKTDHGCTKSVSQIKKKTRQTDTHKAKQEKLSAWTNYSTDLEQPLGHLRSSAWEHPGMTLSTHTLR